MRKTVFAVSTKVRLKSVCSATETSKNIGTLQETKLSTILCRQQRCRSDDAGALASLCLCCLHAFSRQGPFGSVCFR